MKGFVGGIPIALLAVAAQAKFIEHQEHGFVPQAGGTAMGGPSGDDSDGGFISPYSANVKTNTQVNEYSKDDHHVNLKHTDVFPPHHVHFGPPVAVKNGPQVPGMGPFVERPQVPGEGPFKKRGTPGGTAMGGPSGDDEGQVFNMPITGIFQTEVNDYNKDDHSVAVKDTHVHPAPVHVVHPPPQFHGPPHGYHGRPAGPPSAAFNAPPSTFEKRWGPEKEGGTAMGGPGGGSHHGPAGFPHPHGGTAMGGPSGDDDGISFSKPVTGHFKTSVNEYSKDDHSIDLKHKDVYAPRFPPWGAPFKRSWGPEHEQGGTAMGGPSGNDGGQEFNAPITIDTDTDVNEHYEDDHSIDLKHKDIYAPPPPFGGPGPVVFGAHPPFRRAYSPNREAGGGTAMGGPSGDDDGTSFSDPTNIDVTTGVNEHHEDNHAVKGDFTHVHPNVHPYWDDYEEAPYSYESPPAPVEYPVTENFPTSPKGHPAPPAEVSESHPAPPAPHAENPQAPTEASPSAPPMAPAPAVAEAPPREDHQECAAKVHEVVRTVTKTQYKTVEATPEYKQSVPTSAVPMAATPQMSAQVDPKVFSNAISASAPASSAVRSYAPYSYASERPMSQSAPYSMISVHVPMATPASSSYAMATPSSSMAKMMPTGVDALSHGSQSSAAASPSASVHATMFEGGAARLSGGLFSAAAGVMGVLAFIL
ncbi:hypothetical protein PENANT_c028G11120 [Penicillium antarcticum]|uniref:GPI anchored protein n=1 Tax=Penicillium antarcticum TaxID=416450 RepID=A0A1V6PW98_9EURO|nr:hypothetical protein PENANT_c028G11120 [Penicillium antarcticum]